MAVASGCSFFCAFGSSGAAAFNDFAAGVAFLAGVAFAAGEAVAAGIAFTSIAVAFIVYVTVTVLPFLRSPLTLVVVSRAISHFWVPLWITTIEALTLTTCPVAW